MNRVVSWLGQKSRIVMLSLLMASMFVILMPVNSSAVLDFGPKVTQEVCGLNGGSMDSDKNTCVFTSKNNTTEQDISDFRSACQDKLKGVYSATTSLGGDQYSNKLNVTCTVALSVDTSLPKIDALIPKLCSPDRQTNGPVGGNQATYADCSQEVRRIYIKCNPAQTATDEDVAKCITDAIKDNSLITIRPNANDLSSSLANADQKTCGSKGDGFVWNADTKTCDAKPAAGDNKDQASCQTQAQGFGWILCPGMSMLSGAINSAVGFVSGGMEWNLLINSGDNNKSASESIREAWNGIRSVANIAFAIVFMIIIYSTATSTGISNYSIKKILPRLIIIAVGMNISFEICAAMADLSNIAGKGLYDLITSFMVGQQSVSWIEGAAREIAAGGVAIGLIIVGLIAWSATLIGLITIVAAIAMRSVLLTMLVIFSPLAFVAALLPNTEKWWKKWRDTYIQLLIVYPAFMSVWAICQLVANISAQTQEWGWIVATLCVIAPIFVIIPLFKASGGFMGKMTGWAQKGIGAAGGNWAKSKNKDQRERWGKDALDFTKRVTNNRKNPTGRLINRWAYSGERLKAREAGKERARGQASRSYIANLATNDEKFAKQLGGGKATIGKAIAIAQRDNQVEEDRKNAALLLEDTMDGSTGRNDWNSFEDVLAEMKKAYEEGNTANTHALGVQASKLATAGPELDKLMTAVNNMSAKPEFRGVQNSLTGAVSGSSSYSKRVELGGAGIAWMNGSSPDSSKSIQDFTASRLTGNIVANKIGSTINLPALKQQAKAALESGDPGIIASFKGQLREAALNPEIYSNIDNSMRDFIQDFEIDPAAAIDGRGRYKIARDAGNPLPPITTPVTTTSTSGGVTTTTVEDKAWFNVV